MIGASAELNGRLALAWTLQRASPFTISMYTGPMKPTTHIGTITSL